MAISLPHHGRCLLDHIHPIHRTCRSFRPLTPRSLLTSLTYSAPVIDNPEPNLPLTAIFDVLCPFCLSWLRLLLTLLEALVIHLLVFIVYYGPYRTDNNGSISNSVVDLYLVISLPLTLYIQQFAFPSLSNPLTKSNTHPSCQVSIYSNPFPVPSSPSPFCL